MKKIHVYGISLLVVVLMGLMPAREAAGQLGFSVGVNYSKLSDITQSSITSRFEDASGWHAEVWFDLDIGTLTLRPGLRYTMAGKVFKIEGVDDPNLQANFNVNMLELPMDFRFRFNMQVATPYVALGPVLRFPSASKGSVSGLNSMSVAGGFGVGLEMNLGVVVLYPELKFTFGISSFTESEFAILDAPFTADENLQLNGVMIRLGVGF